MFGLIPSFTLLLGTPASSSYRWTIIPSMAHKTRRKPILASEKSHPPGKDDHGLELKRSRAASCLAGHKQADLQPDAGAGWARVARAEPPPALGKGLGARP